MVEDKRLDIVWHLYCIRKAIKILFIQHKKEEEAAAAKNRISLSIPGWEAISEKPKMSSRSLCLSERHADAWAKH